MINEVKWENCYLYCIHTQILHVFNVNKYSFFKNTAMVKPKLKNQ